MSDTVLTLKNLRVRLPAQSGYVYAVDSLDLPISRGETLCLVGESGSGKSVTAQSLLRLLDEAEYGEESEIQCEGDDLLKLPEVKLCKIRGTKIAIIFQEPMTSLNPVLTIQDQIGEALKQHTSLKGSEIIQRVKDLLSDVGIGDPAHLAQSYPHQLSGGMRQRVMIALAIAADPDILIADEPTTALDVTIQAQVLSLIQSLAKKRNMAVLLITHDLGIVSSVADKVAVMYAGHLVEASERNLFFSGNQAPKHPYSQGLIACLPDPIHKNRPLANILGQIPLMHEPQIGCRFAPRCQYAWDLCKQTTPELLPFEGAWVRCHLYTTQGKSYPELAVPVEELRSIRTEIERPEILSVKHLCVKFPIKKGLFKRTVGTVTAVDDLNFTLKQGQTLALVGESGCGKTSAAFAMMRLIQEGRGQVIFQGLNLLKIREKKLRSLRRYIQMIFQDPMGSLNPRMTIREILTEGWDAQGIYLNSDQRQTQLMALIQSVGLPENSLDRYPHEFSGGQHQRIAIARAVGMDPKIIICDEPTSALDVSVQAQIINLLKNLQADKNLSYIFISHNIPVVSYLAHEVAVMYLGRIVEYGKVDEIMDTPKHPYTQALLKSVPLVSAQAQPIQPLTGEIPSPAHPPEGCHFHPRCPYAMPKCRITYPGHTVLSESHKVRCYLYEDKNNE